MAFGRKRKTNSAAAAAQRLLDQHLIENIRILQHARRGTALLVGILSTGTLGYMVIEGWGLLDALFMTVITLSTIGYGETHPLSPMGRLFTIGLILFGVGMAAYLLAGGTSFFVAGGVEAFRRRQRMHDQLRRISDHTIVCGFGRLGSAIVAELQHRGAKVVVVERNAEAMERLSALRVPYLIGDASQDEVLIAAGIMRARTLVAAVNDDAHNVFLTLSARVLTRDENPSLHIHGKADDPASLQKLKRAGADHQFSPPQVLGHRIAHQILRPAVTDLIGFTQGRGGEELAIEEVEIAHLQLPVGTKLSQSPLWGRQDVLVLSVRRLDGTLVFPPKGDLVLEPTDRAVVMGRADRLAQMIQ